ncbi:MAG TPA: Holliday junction branch migration protein RuvA [Anaeromyxobacteraceae bacterium]|nr:Holliday junction branch migration protein RuvA [Anaeromyxobacteraceae bacterium]
MIARLAGLLAEKGEDTAVVDVGGVGYLVHLSAASLLALPPVGERVALRTITHVREDALDLFGFATAEEEDVFRALIDVKGVGPRAAQNILSGIEPRDLAQAVAQGDVARLTRVPGVGKKTAERLVVELKEKLVALARAAGPAAPRGPGGVVDQLEAALVNLGYKPAQAEQVVEALRDGAEGKGLDELLREALKAMRG